MSFSLTGVNWKLVSFVLFFRYDLKLGFPLGFNLFVRCGSIFMNKLLNCIVISFLSVILVSFTCRKLVLHFGFFYNISYVFLMSFTYLLNCRL